MATTPISTNVSGKRFVTVLLKSCCNEFISPITRASIFPDGLLSKKENDIVWICANNFSRMSFIIILAVSDIILIWIRDKNIDTV